MEEKKLTRGDGLDFPSNSDKPKARRESQEPKREK